MSPFIGGSLIALLAQEQSTGLDQIYQTISLLEDSMKVLVTEAKK